MVQALGKCVSHIKAVHASVLSGDTLEKLFLSVAAPHPGALLPFPSTKIFSTYSDNRPCALIPAFAGESTSTQDNQDNNLLGLFELSSVPSTFGAVPQIKLFFDARTPSCLEHLGLDRSAYRLKLIIITTND